MYDAILFAVMVSLSGMVLIPALTSNISVDTSVESHREKLVDEALLMIMTSRVDDFDYIFAGTQMDEVASMFGMNISAEEGIYRSLTKSFLGKEQVHKRYVDLCVENLASQIKVMGCRVNIFTEDYDHKIDKKLTNLLNEFFGDKYEFNLTATWHPINGISFGGEIEIGKTPPIKNTYIARSYVTMPNIFSSDFFDGMEEFIELETSNFETYVVQHSGNETEITDAKKLYWNLLNKTVYGIIFDGFEIGETKYDSLINKSLDCIFDKIQGSLSDIFGNEFKKLDEFFDISGFDLCPEIDSILIESIESKLSFQMDDFNQDGQVNLDDAIFGLKNYTKTQAKNEIKNILDDQIKEFVEDSFRGMKVSEEFDLENINNEISGFLNKKINPRRAEFCLTIWGARE